VLGKRGMEARKVGNGVTLNIWNAPWVFQLNGFKPKPIIDNPINPTLVFELIPQNPIKMEQRKSGKLVIVNRQEI
jgi:hypothetical protein